MPAKSGLFSSGSLRHPSSGTTFGWISNSAMRFLLSRTRATTPQRHDGGTAKNFESPRLGQDQRCWQVNFTCLHCIFSSRYFPRCSCIWIIMRITSCRSSGNLQKIPSSQIAPFLRMTVSDRAEQTDRYDPGAPRQSSSFVLQQFLRRVFLGNRWFRRSVPYPAPVESSSEIRVPANGSGSAYHNSLAREAMIQTQAAHYIANTQTYPNPRDKICAKKVFGDFYFYLAPRSVDGVVNLAKMDWREEYIRDEVCRPMVEGRLGGWRVDLHHDVNVGMEGWARVRVVRSMRHREGGRDHGDEGGRGDSGGGDTRRREDREVEEQAAAAASGSISDVEVSESDRRFYRGFFFADITNCKAPFCWKRRGGFLWEPLPLWMDWRHREGIVIDRVRDMEEMLRGQRDGYWTPGEFDGSSSTEDGGWEHTQEISGAEFSPLAKSSSRVGYDTYDVRIYLSDEESGSGGTGTMRVEFIDVPVDGDGFNEARRPSLHEDAYLLERGNISSPYDVEADALFPHQAVELAERERKDRANALFPPQAVELAERERKEEEFQLPTAADKIRAKMRSPPFEYHVHPRSESSLEGVGTREDVEVSTAGGVSSSSDEDKDSRSSSSDEDSRASIYVLVLDSVSRLTLKNFAPRFSRLLQDIAFATGTMNSSTSTWSSGSSSASVPLSAPVAFEFHRFHTPVFGGTIPNLFPVFYGGSRPDCVFHQGNKTEAPVRCTEGLAGAADGGDHFTSSSLGHVLKEEGAQQQEQVGGHPRSSSSGGFAQSRRSHRRLFALARSLGFRVAFSATHSFFPVHDRDLDSRLPEIGALFDNPQDRSLEHCVGSDPLVARVWKWNEAFLSPLSVQPRFLVSHVATVRELGRPAMRNLDRGLTAHVKRMLWLTSSSNDHGRSRHRPEDDSVISHDRWTRMRRGRRPLRILIMGDHGVADVETKGAGASAHTSGHSETCDQQRPFLAAIVPRGPASLSREGLEVQRGEQNLFQNPSAVRTMQNRLVSAWDVYATLKEWILGAESGDHFRADLRPDVRELTASPSVLWRGSVSSGIKFRVEEMRITGLFATSLRTCREAGVWEPHCDHDTAGARGAMEKMHNGRSVYSGIISNSLTPGATRPPIFRSFHHYCAPYVDLHNITKAELFRAFPTTTEPVLTSEAENHDEDISSRTCRVWAACVLNVANAHRAEFEDLDHDKKCKHPFSIKHIERVEVKVFTTPTETWLNDAASMTYRVEVTTRFSLYPDHRLYELTTEYVRGSLAGLEEPPRRVELFVDQGQVEGAGASAMGGVAEDDVVDAATLEKERQEMVYLRGTRELTRYKKYEQCTPANLDPMWCNCL